MRFSLLTSLLASLVFATNAYAATLNVVGGQLMGASNVLVDGSLYDVQFLDGLCIDLYNGCDDLSDFTFQTQASATLASQALLDQVFLDGVDGLFDADPGLTNGCADPIECAPMTPYGFYPPGVEIVVSRLSINGALAGDTSAWGFTYPSQASSDLHEWGGMWPQALTFAVWSSAPIPEPSTALLLSLGLTGLAAKGRGRNRS